MNVVTATPLWKLWADALDRAAQGIAFVTNAGNQCAPTAGAGLTVNIASGTVVVNTNATTTAIAAGSVTPTSPTNFARRDIVFISSLGVLTLTQGTEGAAPVPPALPTGACLIAVLFIPQSATDYSAGFPTAGIEDLRVIVSVDNAVGVASPRTLGTGAQQAAVGTHTTPVFVASGASHAAGHVPDPGAAAGTTKFLREDATFATPPSQSVVNIKSINFASVTTAETTTSTSYVDLTTPGPSITDTAAASDNLDVTCDSQWNAGGSNSITQFHSPKLDAIATADVDGVGITTPAGSATAIGASSNTRFAAVLAASHTVKMQYKTSAGTGDWQNRRISQVRSQ